jgi:hypothetical protein
MVDKIGMMRLKKKRLKKAEENALKEVGIYFDELNNFIADKIVNDNYVLIAGDEKSIKMFSETFVLEPLKFDKNSLVYDNIVKGENIFYFLKKDDRFRKYVDLARTNDKEFGNINVDKLVFILMLYDNLTDFITIGTRHNNG